MKKYVVIAGVNGAGKSTLYQTTRTLQNMLRVNTDEFNRFAIYKNGELVRLSHRTLPEWYIKLKI